ncbi:NusG domain II-containing protein [Isobaculum melis]|nr:NusG domain II-containing protein [Isobaculum melis]
MVFLIFISFLPLVIFTISQKDVPKDAEVYALITVDNQEYKKITLSNHQGTDTIRYENEDGDYNIIEIKDETIRVIEASCRDQVDVLKGAISKPGETLLCLPHKLAIEIKTEQPEDTEEDEIIRPS